MVQNGKFMPIERNVSFISLCDLCQNFGFVFGFPRNQRSLSGASAVLHADAQQCTYSFESPWLYPGDLSPTLGSTCGDGGHCCFLLAPKDHSAVSVQTCTLVPSSATTASGPRCFPPATSLLHSAVPAVTVAKLLPPRNQRPLSSDGGHCCSLFATNDHSAVPVQTCTLVPIGAPTASGPRCFSRRPLSCTRQCL